MLIYRFPFDKGPVAIDQRLKWCNRDRRKALVASF